MSFKNKRLNGILIFVFISQSLWAKTDKNRLQNIKTIPVVKYERELKDGVVKVYMNRHICSDVNFIIVDYMDDTHCITQGLNVISLKVPHQYNGQLTGAIGDLYSTHQVYEVMDTYYYDPQKGYNVDESSNPLTKFDPMVDVKIGLAGPLFHNKLSAYASGQYYTTLGPVYGRRWFTPQGLPGDSALVNLNPSKNYIWHTTLSYRPSPKLNIRYRLKWQKTDKDRDDTPLARRYVPDGVRQLHQKGHLHTVILNQEFSTNSFLELRIEKMFDHSEQFKYKNPYQTPQYTLSYTDDQGDLIHYEYQTNVEKEAKLKWIKEQGYAYQFDIDPEHSEGYTHPTWNYTRDIGNAPASFDAFHVPYDFNYATDEYWKIRFDMTQLFKNHRFQTGLEFVQHEYFRENFSLRAATEIGRDGIENEIEPSIPSIPPLSSIAHDKYTMKPREFSAYLQDKLKIKNWMFNVGLRFEYFNANHIVPVDPRDPDIYQPVKDEWQYANWQEPSTEWKIAQGIDPNQPLNSTQEALYLTEMLENGTIREYTPDERRNFMHKKVKAKKQLSPRIGICYTISDALKFKFSYGHYFQTPLFNTLYLNPDYKLGSGGSAISMGNADLKPETGVKYRLGFQCQLNQQMKADVLFFHYRIQNLFSSYSSLHSTDISDLHDYYQFINSDHAIIKGLIVRLDKWLSDHFSFRLNYKLQSSENVDSDPYDSFLAYTDGQIPFKTMVPLDFDRRHTFSGIFNFQINGWICKVAGTLMSGETYSPTVKITDPIGSASYSGWTKNSKRLPTISTIDLFLERNLFNLLGLNNFIYLQIDNLFDQKGAVNVFSDTGSPAYDSYTTHQYKPYDPSRIGSLEHWLLRPSHYQPPREIWLGYRVTF